MQTIEQRIIRLIGDGVGYYNIAKQLHIDYDDVIAFRDIRHKKAKAEELKIKDK